jgi:hypothetical protein
VKWIQQCGRLLRPWNGITPIVLDHSGNAVEHGLPHQDREWSLDAPKKKKKDEEKAPPCRVCKTCFAVVPLGVSQCPECGAEFYVPTREPETVDGTLKEVTIADVKANTDKRLAEWNELCRQCDEKRYKPGWAKYRFKEKFGMWPSYPWNIKSQEWIDRHGGTPTTAEDRDRFKKRHAGIEGLS